MKKILNKETGEITMEEDAVNYNTVEGYEPISWKTPWNHNTSAESDRTGTSFVGEKTKTQQHLAAEADINNILRKFLETGELNTVGTPIYQDAEELYDLQDKMITAHQVQDAWDKLPQPAKELLGDPRRFTAYVERALETGDIEALRRIDLINPAPTEPPTPTGGTPAPVPAETAPNGP